MRRIRFIRSNVKTLGLQWWEGDVKTLPRESADEMIRAGWAVDADTDEGPWRGPGTVVIQPDAVVVDIE